MANKLYEHFYDPTKKFIEELRAFCYDLSQKLINEAKTQSLNNWYTCEKTTDVILSQHIQIEPKSVIRKSCGVNLNQKMGEESIV